MRRITTHPEWCARGHHCTAHKRDGQHRSHPTTTDTGACRLIATRAQTAGGRLRVELRAVVDLPPDPNDAEPVVWDTITAVINAITTNPDTGGER
jgi:hypothetical protein